MGTPSWLQKLSVAEVCNRSRVNYMAGRRRAANGRRRGRRGNGRAGAQGAPAAVPRALKPWTVTRSFNLGSLTPVAVEFGDAFVANLNQMPSFGEFTSLFQEYRIVYAVYELTYLPAATERYTPVVWYGNYIASQARSPTTLEQVMQLSGTRKFAFGPDKRTLRLGFKPKIRTGDSVQQMRASPWIAMASTNVSHYGLWVWYQYFTATFALGSNITITATFTLSFRGSQ